MILFLEWLEACRTVRGTIYRRGGPAPENFRMTSIDICYLGGELCVSDNLEDSRGTDEESELSSVLTHPTPRRRHCQHQAPFKKPTDCLDGSNALTLEFLMNGGEIRLSEGWLWSGAWRKELTPELGFAHVIRERPGDVGGVGCLKIFVEDAGRDFERGGDLMLR